MPNCFAVLTNLFCSCCRAFRRLASLPELGPCLSFELPVLRPS